MAADNNIKKFTAADIEKYHKGLLSANEMHSLEKATLDDPFLADALEGYATAGVNISADITELKKRLAEKTEQAKVLPIRKGGGTFTFLRVAAMFIILAGGAYLTWQLASNKKQDNIANVQIPQKEEAKTTTDTSITPGISGILSTDTKTTENSTAQIKVNTAKATGTGTKPANIDRKTKIENNLATAKASDEVTRGEDLKTKAPVSVPAEQKDVVNVTASEKRSLKIDSTKDIAARKNQDFYAVKDDKDAADQKKFKQEIPSANSRNAGVLRKAEAPNDRINTFRGRVTDASNVGVPFANVTNVQDNAGTYADANGYFNLTSPDTVLNVQVRSIGFENNNSQLRNNVAFNKVVLQDDRKTLNEVVISNQRPNTEARARNADANKTLEEPEPADGWAKYDAYLANNLNIPDDFDDKPKPTAPSSVEVSFEVDKNGEPIHIKIEKSLCGKCDKEAIRLIKEGPKWKRNANKKGRTTVTINF